jgi:SAM-dependent methyltransferase
MNVGDLMTRNPQTVRGDEPLMAAVTKMWDVGFGAVLVVDEDDGLKGILRAWDIIALLAQGFDLDIPCGPAVVGFASVLPQQGMDAAATVAMAENSDFLPVVESGKVVGALTHYDFAVQRALEPLLGPRTRGLLLEISSMDPHFNGQRGPYLLAGASALDSVKRVLDATDHGEVSSVLDMGCGYGRETRMLRAAFPDASITACDADPRAVTFCAETFGARPARWSGNPTDIGVDGSYDLIWAGALFPSLDPEQWPDHLRMLETHLDERGVLIFTTLAWQNSSSLRLLGVPEPEMAPLEQTYEDRGFAYCPRLEDRESGLTLSAPGWTRWLVHNSTKLRVVKQLPGEWATPYPRADVIACRLLDDE